MSQNAEYVRPHWRLYCRIFGHHWLPMTGEWVWAPITCGRCGFVVEAADALRALAQGDGSDDA